MLIADGRARSFGFHAVFRNGRVELESEGCAFSYAVPEMPWYCGFNEPALPIQIEPGMALYLKPRGGRHENGGGVATAAAECRPLGRGP